MMEEIQYKRELAHLIAHIFEARKTPRPHVCFGRFYLKTNLSCQVLPFKALVETVLNPI